MPSKDESPSQIGSRLDQSALDISKNMSRTRLPHSTQVTLDNKEDYPRLIDEKPQTDTTDSNVRYAGYAARLRTILSSAHRYIAYTSDLGESFRPVAHPYLIRSAYGISWLYIGGDVVYEGYKAWKHNQAVINPAGALASALHGQTGQQDRKVLEPAMLSHLRPGTVSLLEDYRTVMAQRMLFQGVASMALPAFTIHSIVKYSGRAMKNAKNKTLRIWAPIGLGLAAVPFLPYFFDRPVEQVVEWAFHKGSEKFVKPKLDSGKGSSSLVASSPPEESKKEL